MSDLYVFESGGERREINLGPGVAELLADPAHYRRHPMECVDYGPPPEERLPEPLLTRRSLLRRFLGKR
jgi:hypothetical protein